LISCVFPGVPEILASLFRLHNMLMSELLPTFDRPINAYSGMLGSGSLFTSVLLITNAAEVISILQNYVKEIRMCMFLANLNSKGQMPFRFFRVYIRNCNQDTRFFNIPKVFVNTCAECFHRCGQRHVLID